MLAMVLLYILLLHSFNIAVGFSENLVHEHGLCRQCGREITELSFISEVESPFSVQTRNFSTLTQKPVLVQTLINPNGLLFSIVTVNSAGCKPVGGWHSEATWFPNYNWSLCVCPQCGAHLGWAFRGTNSSSSKADFFALIEDSILRESFVDSLLAVPQGYHSI